MCRLVEVFEIFCKQIYLSLCLSIYLFNCMTSTCAGKEPRECICYLVMGGLATFLNPRTVAERVIYVCGLSDTGRP